MCSRTSFGSLLVALLAFNILKYQERDETGAEVDKHDSPSERNDINKNESSIKDSNN